MPNRLTQDQLVRAIADMDRHYAAILFGAGASRTSGILLAREIVHDLCLDCYCESSGLPATHREHVRATDVRQWLQMQSWFAAAKDKGESDYSAVFRQFKPTPEHQIAYITKLVEVARPAKAYDGLAHLVKEGVFDIALTTNFDPLFESRYRGLFPVKVLNVLKDEHDFQFATADSNRRQVAYLHGSLDGYSISNLDEHTRLLNTQAEAAIARMLDGYALVVIGYSGQDKSVMSLLQRLATNHGSCFRRGTIYWCHLPDDDLSPAASQLLDSVASGFTVETFGFDRIVEALCQKTRLGVDVFANSAPAPELTTSGRTLPDRASLNVTPPQRVPQVVVRFRTKLKRDRDLDPHRDRYTLWQGTIKENFFWLLGDPSELPKELLDACSLTPEPCEINDAAGKVWNIFLELANRALRRWLCESIGLRAHGDRAERYYFSKPADADDRVYSYMSRHRRTRRKVVWLEFERGEVGNLTRYYCHEAVRPRIMRFQGEPVLRLSPTRLFTIEGKDVWTGKTAGTSVGRATSSIWNAEYDSLVRMWLELFAAGNDNVTIPYCADARKRDFRLEFANRPYTAIRVTN